MTKKEALKLAQDCKNGERYREARDVFLSVEEGHGVGVMGELTLGYYSLTVGFALESLAYSFNGDIA